MKKFLFIGLGTLFILLSSTSFVQSQKLVTENHPRIIVMLGTASWCPLCQKHGDRISSEIIEVFSADSSYQIVINNLSNDSTTAASLLTAINAGIEAFAAKHRSTGVLYFINKENKKLIAKISVKESSEKIKQVFNDAIK